MVCSFLQCFIHIIHIKVSKISFNKDRFPLETCLQQAGGNETALCHSGRDYRNPVILDEYEIYKKIIEILSFPAIKQRIPRLPQPPYLAIIAYSITEFIESSYNNPLCKIKCGYFNKPIKKHGIIF